jgi:hypothetical protein
MRHDHSGRRHADGGIDFAYYRRRAARWRWRVLRAIVRRGVSPLWRIATLRRLRQALNATPRCVGASDARR